MKRLTKEHKTLIQERDQQRKVLDNLDAKGLIDSDVPILMYQRKAKTLIDIPSPYPKKDVLKKENDDYDALILNRRSIETQAKSLVSEWKDNEKILQSNTSSPKDIAFAQQRKEELQERKKELLKEKAENDAKIEKLVKAAPKKKAVTKKVAPKKAAPKKAVIKKEVAPKKAVTKKEVAPKKAVIKKEVAPKKAVTKKEVAPKKAAPKKAVTKKAVAPKKEVVPVKLVPRRRLNTSSVDRLYKKN